MGSKFVPALKTFLPSILSGGLILGAIFMATDYVTTPNTKLGNYIYFVLLGILTAVLRKAVKRRGRFVCNIAYESARSFYSICIFAVNLSVT